jgi:hypothetical protein
MIFSAIVIDSPPQAVGDRNGFDWPVKPSRVTTPAAGCLRLASTGMSSRARRVRRSGLDWPALLSGGHKGLLRLIVIPKEDQSARSGRPPLAARRSVAGQV